MLQRLEDHETCEILSNYLHHLQTPCTARWRHAAVVAIEDANQSAKQNIIQGHTQVRGLSYPKCAIQWIEKKLPEFWLL